MAAEKKSQKRPRKSRVRRNRDEVEASVLELAQKGPFTPSELAKAVGFTSNRARQLLESLRKQGKLVPLGLRRGGRGKPSKVWGLPGTEVTEADLTVTKKAKAPKAARAPRAETKAAPAARSTKRSGASPAAAGEGFLDRLLGALRDGLEIKTPEGGVYEIRLMSR